jgi:hypothetical protein
MDAILRGDAWERCGSVGLERQFKAAVLPSRTSCHEATRSLSALKKQRPEAQQVPQHRRKPQKR